MFYRPFLFALAAGAIAFDSIVVHYSGGARDAVTAARNATVIALVLACLVALDGLMVRSGAWRVLGATSTAWLAVGGVAAHAVAAGCLAPYSFHHTLEACGRNSDLLFVRSCAWAALGCNAVGCAMAIVSRASI